MYISAMVGPVEISTKFRQFATLSAGPKRTFCPPVHASLLLEDAPQHPGGLLVNIEPLRQ